MATDVVLFLRDAVAQEALHTALENLFGVALHSDRLPNDAAQGALTIVAYAEGFALGIGIELAQHPVLPAQAVATALAAQFGTEVLLEAATGGRSQWTVVEPGASAPYRVQVVELRHGLETVPPPRALQERRQFRYA